MPMGLDNRCMQNGSSQQIEIHKFPRSWHVLGGKSILMYVGDSRADETGVWHHKHGLTLCPAHLDQVAPA